MNFTDFFGADAPPINLGFLKYSSHERGEIGSNIRICPANSLVYLAGKWDERRETDLMVETWREEKSGLYSLESRSKVRPWMAVDLKQ